MKTVKEVSRISGVSVRTLHHYDAIGLLRPTALTDSGYRLYDDEALCRLQTILFFRELEFPLKQISAILDDPAFDPMSALADQIQLLRLRREQLDRLILHATNIQKTGVIPMDFSAFDHTRLDTYAEEAKRRWGHTEAYRECAGKTAGQSKDQLLATGNNLMDIFARMGQIRHQSPGSPEAQALVKELQEFITEHYYTCHKQILAGLGQMYIAGDEMTANIDRAGGQGTAQFAHDAIEIYCK